jgi:alkaline phosphatase
MIWKAAIALSVSCAMLAGMPATAGAGQAKAKASEPSRKAKNVILFVGDGAGFSTLHAASVSGYEKPQALFVQNNGHFGVIDTSTVTNWVTDAGAGATAFATGHKTKNLMISQAPDGEFDKKEGTWLKTILEDAEEHGLSTGTISNNGFLNAIPAAFFGHSNSRRNFPELVQQIVAPRYGDGIDVVIGPRNTAAAGDLFAGQEQQLKNLADKGFAITTTFAQQNVKAGKKHMVLTETEDFDMQEAVSTAIAALSKNDKGYFLVVHSDTHLKDVPKSLRRMVDFDKVVEKTVREHPDTLVLFTSDHAWDVHTMKSAPRGQPIVDYLVGDKVHSAEQVPLIGMGPGSEAISGFMDNVNVFDIMANAFGWTIPRDADGRPAISRK